jgi:hypothetical protein
MEISETSFIDVVSTYTQTTRVELPEDYDVTQIDDIWVKWGTVHVEFKQLNETAPKLVLVDENSEIDTKRPDETRAYNEYGNQIFEG